MDDLMYRTYTLVVQVRHQDHPIELAQIDAQLPSALASRPADLLDAFALMLTAGADRIEAAPSRTGRRVLRSTFRPIRSQDGGSPRRHHSHKRTTPVVRFPRGASPTGTTHPNVWYPHCDGGALFDLAQQLPNHASPPRYTCRVTANCGNG